MRGMPPLSRRPPLVGLPATATGRRAHPQPKVFLDYDQDALDRAYDQRAWAPNMDAVLKRYVVNSDGVRARLGAPKTVAYGASAIETLDIYPTARVNAPVLVFVHGGAWRTGKARDSAYAAEAFVRAGAHYVVPDFATVMDVGLDGMVAQVRQAVAWVARNASSFGGDPGRIYVAGHSSGGHLAGTVLAAIGLAAHARLSSPTLIRNRRSSRGNRASSPRPSGPRAGSTRSSWARATTTSRSPRRWPAPTASSAAPHST